MEAEFISIIAQLVIKYGIPGAIAIINNWNDDNEITMAKLIKLKENIKSPESFFE